MRVRGVDRFEDLIVWQLADELRREVFAATEAGKAARDFRYRDQIRDASSSAARNTAEGFGRFNPGEFAHFLDFARASLRTRTLNPRTQRTLEPSNDNRPNDYDPRMLQNPYSSDLADRDPLQALRDTPNRIRALVHSWTAAQFERSLAPGKWSARQILIHLAQTELALGTRARMALCTSPYAAQAFDQDRWMARDSTVSGAEALDALLAIGAMNRALFQSLSAADRATPFSHPEYGNLTVDWLIHQMAGHQIHHLKQLEAIATR